MAITSTGTSNFSSLVENMIERKLEAQLRSNLPFATPGSYRNFVHVPGGNDTFVAPTVADIVASVDSASFLVEGTPPTPVELALDKDTFTGRQFGKVVSISDLAEWESPFSMADTAAEKVSRWAAEIINLVAQSAFVSCTNVIYAGGASAGSATSGKMTAADLGLAVARLRMAGVPQFPWGYTAILSPRQIVDISSETAANSWANAVRYTDSGPLLAGEVGYFQGCRILDGGKIVQNATTSGAGGVDLLTGVVFGPEAIGLGDIGTVEVHVVNQADHQDPLNQTILVGTKLWIGAGYLGKAGDKAILLKTAGTILAAGQH